jgi:hypothetical protein
MDVLTDQDELGAKEENNFWTRKSFDQHVEGKIDTGCKSDRCLLFSVCPYRYAGQDDAHQNNHQELSDEIFDPKWIIMTMDPSGITCRFNQTPHNQANMERPVPPPFREQAPEIGEDIEDKADNSDDP